MAVEQIIFEFDVKGGDAALKEAAELNVRIRKNKEAIKELSAAYEENAVEITELQQENKELAQSQRLLAKSAHAVEGSYDALSSEMSQLKKEQKRINVSTKEGQKEFERYGKRINDINSKLKKLDETNGVHTRNVGNYQLALKDAAGQLNIMGVNVGQVSAQFSQASQMVQATTGAIGGANKMLKLLRVAIIGTGIGALVLALVSLVTYFSKTQEGGEKLRVVFKQIGQVVNVLIERLTKVGAGLMAIFSGNFKTGIDELKNAFKGMGDEIEREVQLMGALEKRLIQIEKAESLLNIVRSATRARVKELNKLAEDTTKSYEARAAAAREALEIETNLMNSQIELQKQRIANLLGEVEGGEKLQNVLNTIGEGYTGIGEAAASVDQIISQIGLDPSTFEDFQELERLLTGFFDVQLQSLEQQTTLQNKLNTIEEQRIKNQKTSGVAGVIKRRTVAISEELAVTEQLTESTKEFETVTVNAYTNATTESDKYLANQLKIAKTQEFVFNDLQTGFTAAQDIAGQYYNFINARMQAELAQAGNNAEKREAIELKYAKKRQKIDKAMAIIGGARAIIQLWANQSVMPSPANEIYKTVMSGLIAATTAAQVSAISNQQFAKGGLTEGGMFEGPSHANGGVKFKVGGRIHEAEGGEAIINKRSTSLFKPILSAINQAGGGKKFETGGMTSFIPSMSGIMNKQIESEQLKAIEMAMSQQKTVLQIPVTTAIQNGINTVEANATL